MKKFFAISAAAVLLLSITCQAKYQLDLKRSVDRITKQIQVTKEKPAQWGKLDRIIDDLLECISGIELPIFEVKDAKWMPPALVQYLETVNVASIASLLKEVDWSAVEEVAKISSPSPQDFLDDLKEFMKTENFVKMHTHIWSNGEFIDLLSLWQRAGYPQIFETFKTFYEMMGRGDLPIPDAPEAVQQSTTRTNWNLPQSSGNRFPEIKINPPSIKVECTGNPIGALPKIFAILERLNDANIQEVLKVFLYTLQEVLGNVAMHVLLLKMGEPQKGDFFHSTLELEGVKEEGIVYIQGLVLNNPGIAQLNEVLKQVTGLDLGNRDLFNYLTNLIQYLVWNYPFPSESEP